MPSTGRSKPTVAAGHSNRGSKGCDERGGRGPTGRARQQTQEVTTEILRVARQQVADSGTIVVRQIASAIGISAAAIYHHVPGLAEIKRQVAFSVDSSVAGSLGLISREYGEGSLDALVAGSAYLRVWALAHPREFAFTYCGIPDSHGPQTDDSAVITWIIKALEGTDAVHAPSVLHELVGSPLFVQYFGLLTLEVAGRLPAGRATTFNAYWRIFERSETGRSLEQHNLAKLQGIALRYSRAALH